MDFVNKIYVFEFLVVLYFIDIELVHYKNACFIAVHNLEINLLRKHLRIIDSGYISF